MTEQPTGQVTASAADYYEENFVPALFGNRTKALLDLAGVSATSVKGQGKLVTYDAGAELHVFSSVTRTWRSYPKSAGASLTLFNDVALLRDGSPSRCCFCGLICCADVHK